MKNVSLLMLLSILSFQFVSASTIYVDNSLSANCLATYNPLKRACGSGTAKAYNTFAGASAVAMAGDTVLIREGTYNEQLAPANSGTVSLLVVFKNYPNEHPIISGNTLNPAIWIFEKHYVAIEGLKIINVRRWLNALGSSHIILRNNTFQNANDASSSSKTGLFFQNSDYNKILNNVIDSTTQDNIAFIQSHHNLVQANTITRAMHVLWVVKCGSYNVFRNNYFHNSMQKIGEIYDCDEVGYGDLGYPKVTSLDDTKYNLVEHNIFAYTPSSGNSSPYAGIQHAGQHSIIRKNVFYNCVGPPLDLTLYASEATFNYGNRIYHNVFYNNEFGGISISGGTAHTFHDNIFKNNILYRNRFTKNDNRWTWYTTLNAEPVQILTGRTSDVFFERNNIFSAQADELWVIANGVRTSSTNPSPETLSWWEGNYSSIFKSNLQSEPMFMDTASRDFHLKTGSPMIDAGVFLTKTTSSGSGNAMVIDSSGYFFDGFGIAGLSGDTVQLEGQPQYAVIKAINYTTNTLTLSKSLTWASGQRLSLKYNGKAPDLGVYEAVAAATGVSTIKQEKNYIIYPNPSTGIFYLNILKPQGNENNSSVEIYNKMGSRIYRSPAFAELAINLSSQPKGIYFLLLLSGENTVSQKIVIQ